MRFEEFIEWQEQVQRNLRKPLENISKWTNSGLFETITESSNILDHLLETYRQVPYQQIIENSKNALLYFQTNSLQTSLDQIANIRSSLEQFAIHSAAISPPDVLIPPDLLSRISNALSDTEPYMAEDVQEECVVILPDKAPTTHGCSISFDRAMALLNLLLAILGLIIQLIPDSQLGEIAEQNEQIIAIQEERLELEKQQAAALEDIAQNLGEIIVDLNQQIETQRQQIESLSEQRDDLNNLTDSVDQNTNTDDQQQNDNFED